jgi:hypothetical protein
MPEIGTSGLTSGDGKRGGAISIVLAPILDSTDTAFLEKTKRPHKRKTVLSVSLLRQKPMRRQEWRRGTQECVRHATLEQLFPDGH